MICWKCKKNIEISKIQRTDECPFCHVDLHCCKTCKFYAPGNHFDCKENVENVIADKEKANFCDYFSPVTDSENNLNENKQLEAKKAAAQLFGDSEINVSDNNADEARKAFNSLFGD